MSEPTPEIFSSPRGVKLATLSLFGITPDPQRPRDTRWQRFKAWVLDKPLSYPWLLRLETWVLERLGRRPRSCVLVARKTDRLLKAFRHEARDLTARGDRAVTDDNRYAGFVPQVGSVGKLVEVRLEDGDVMTGYVNDVGVDQVLVRDQMTDEVAAHFWWNVRLLRVAEYRDEPVQHPGWSRIELDT